ncbi:MAG: nitroreductase family deazaflavin-dependent oxidoreductase [Dehalococcoidia bacterium]
MSEWNNNVMAEFRANGGKVGGVFENMPLLILHTKGAKSGNEHQTPLVYMEDEGKYVIFASQGGAPKHPSWYHNLVANPDVTIEVGTETKEASASVAPQPLRDELYNRNSDKHPQFKEYEAKTTRLIPVVILEPKS